jgi:hypothetical protein
MPITALTPPNKKPALSGQLSAGTTNRERALMIRTTLPASGRRSWLSRWFAGGNHHTEELAHHVIDRIADENARSFAERAKTEADRRFAQADTDVLPRINPAKGGTR